MRKRSINYNLPHHPPSTPSLLAACAAWGHSQAQCDSQEQWTVASASEASALSKTLEGCANGSFVVIWNGHAPMEARINITAGTSLAIIGGNDLDAVVDGGGITQMFYLNDSTLNLTNISLVNGHGDAGGAIYATSYSTVHLDGTIVLAHNYANSGGAIFVDKSRLSWDGNVTFANNTVGGTVEYGPDGGALYVVKAVVNSSGTTTFVNNSAGEDGGAVRVHYEGYIFFYGHTSFIDNQSQRNGGALMATDKSRVEFYGTTISMGSSAGAQGGAFWLGGNTYDTSFMTFHGDTDLSNNRAGESGGAIFVDENCEISWNDTMTLSENIAAEDGGAVSVVGDSTLTIRGVKTSFRGNSAGTHGGAVYSFGNKRGQTYDGVIFDSNSAARGGAVATFSTGYDIANRYTSCIFINNSASATGGAVEASVGSDDFVDSLFQDNYAGAGGALRLSGTVEMRNVTFKGNSVKGEGPAISNIGSFENMSMVSFVDNSFVCSTGEFLEYVSATEYSGTSRYTTVCDGCPERQDCNDCTIDHETIIPTCSAVLDHTSAKEAGILLEQLDIDEGYWRATNTSKLIFKCYNTDACKGGKTGTQHYCDTGYADIGPYCSVCENGYSSTMAFTCNECSSPNRSAVLVVVVVAIGVAAAMVAYLTVFLLSMKKTEARMTRRFAKLIKYFPLSAIKIIIVLWQILTQFTSVANVTYPDIYENFLKAIDVINLDLGWMFSAGCFWPDMDFHDRLLFTTLGPLIAFAYLGATYAFAVLKTKKLPDRASPSHVSRADARERVNTQHMSALLLLSFLVYSSASSNIFRMFACEHLDDENEYLRADYRIICTDENHRALQIYAGIMIFVYPVGIPLMYAVLLYRLRGILRIDGPARFNSPSALTVNTLWAPYRPSVYYYEVVECFRRIMLTGVIVFIFPGDAAQIAVTIVISFVFFVVSEAVRAYESALDIWLSRAGNVVLFFSFFAALLYKVDVSDEREASQKALGVILVVVHVVLALSVLFNALGMWINRNEEDPLAEVCHSLSYSFCLKALPLDIEPMVNAVDYTAACRRDGFQFPQRDQDGII